MSEHKNSFPEFYLTSPQPCPYLPRRTERKLFTHLGGDKPPSYFDNLHISGFRRSQTIAYKPYCENCKACVSVRILVDEFTCSASQKRIMKRNNDITPYRMDASSTSEQYTLFRDYITGRHGDGGMADMSVFDYQAMIEDSVVDSFITEYHHVTDEGKTGNDDLVAVALCDQLCDGISMVYSFFDTNLSGRSLGSYMILETIEYAHSLGLPHVYLGYWVKGSTKMNYKCRYRPQEHLSQDGWVRANDEPLT